MKSVAVSPLRQIPLWAQRMEACFQEYGPRPFLLEGAESWTYGDFHKRACALAQELKSGGVGHGSRVALLMPNGIEFAVGYFACFYLGAAAVPISPNLSLHDIRFILESVHPERILAAPATLPLLAGREDLNTLSLTRSQLEALPAASDFLPFSDCQEEDVAVIVYTSGTTARPKGVAHRFSALIRNASAFSAEHQLGGSNRFYLTLSMAYMGGFYNLFFLPFLLGSSVVMDRVFDVRSSIDFWKSPIAANVNTLWFSPAIMAILLKMDRGKEGEEFCRRTVRRALAGFAPLPVKLQQAFEERYGVPVYQNYGLSETLFVSTTSERFPSVPGSVGRALDGVEIDLSAEDGEIQVRTPDLMAGYVDEQGGLCSESPEIWFKTGDLGRRSPQGEMVITGRKKELIIRGGMNVSPLAVEEVLQGFEGISEVVVVSIPHEIYGEDVVAVLKLNTGTSLASVRSQLAVYAQKHLGIHQQPAHYIEIDEFPTTSTGKIRRDHLRQLVINKLEIRSE